MKLAVLVFLLSPLASASSGHDAPGAAAAKAPSGWEALSILQTGNMRFYEGHPIHPNQAPQRRELLAGGQKPHTIVVSCSDSRAAPETVFDQGLGDIFTVRNAGNVMTTEAIASVEYAVEHLGSKLLIVMGHESCGAVGAAIASRPGRSNGSESLDVLVSKVRSSLSARAVSEAANDKSFRQSVKENVSANLRQLLQKSEIVREAVEKHGLIVGQAIYSLRSGRVEFWEVGRAIEGAMHPEKGALAEHKIEEQEIHDDVKPKAAAPKARVKPKAAQPAPSPGPAPEPHPAPHSAPHPAPHPAPHSAH